MDERDILRELMFGFADMMHERSLIFKKYKKARRIHQEVINSMMEYVGKNKINPDQILTLLKRNIELNFNIKLDSNLYGDLLIYPQIPEFECITQQYLNNHRFKAVDKVKMLEGMMNSYYSVFNIVKRNEEDGIVTLYDVIHRETIQIVDGKLGIAYQGNEYVLLRIIQFDDIKFQTGLTMTFDRDKRSAKLIRSAVNNYKNRYTEILLDFYDYQKYNPSKLRVHTHSNS